MRRHQKTANNSSQSGGESENSLYKNLNFSHVGFTAALELMDPNEPDRPDGLLPPIPRTKPLRIRKKSGKMTQQEMAARDVKTPEQKEKTYASSDLSSSVESSKSDPGLLTSMPINATSDSDPSERGFKILNTEDEEYSFQSALEAERKLTPKPTQPKKSNFYYPQREHTVRTPIKSGFTHGAAVSSRLSRLPARGLSRGLPDDLVRKINSRHPDFPGSMSVPSFPVTNMMGGKILKERLKEDVTETMENDQWGELQIARNPHNLLNISRRVVIPRGQVDTNTFKAKAPEAISMDLSIIQDRDIGETSQHMLDVHEKLKMKDNASF